MRIDHYEFGRMIVGRKEFDRDLIIFPDRILSPWWRAQGHTLNQADLEEVWKEAAEILIIGTGAYGLMVVKDEVRQMAYRRGMKISVHPTAQAVEVFNQLEPQKKIIGAFHLTC